MTEQAEHEIQHGLFLAGQNTERIWGWDTPAGRIRAMRRAEFIAKGAKMDPGSNVLEIGCGTGLFTEMFAKTGAKILAVDISGDLLRKALTRNLPLTRVKFLEKRFEDCELEGPFDAIIGSSILHHLDLEQALPRIYELLKQGGVISFAEPNMLNPQIFIERKFRLFFPSVSPDETAFISWRLKKQLEQAGFTEIEIINFDWLHPAIPRLLINSVSAIGRTLERIPFLRWFSGSLHISARRP